MQERVGCRRLVVEWSAGTDGRISRKTRERESVCVCVYVCVCVCVREREEEERRREESKEGCE